MLTPFFLWVLFIPTFEGRVGALGLFIIGGLSDWLDGKLARLWKANSRFGQFIDPLADKVFVLGTFLALPLLIPQIAWWVVILIALRDLGLTVLRTWAEKNNRPIPTLYSAKVKTTIQFIFLAWILLLRIGETWPPFHVEATWLLHGWVTFILLMITLIATIWTGLQYAWMLWQGYDASA